ARHAAAVHFDDGETEIFVIETLATLWNETKMVEHEAADGGVSGIFRQGDVVLGIEVAHVERGVKDDGTIREGERTLDDVKLVMNLADQLLQDIFQGDEAEDAAELVDDHGHADVAGAQFQEKFAGGLGLWNDEHFANDATQIERLRGDGFFVAPLAIEQD